MTYTGKSTEIDDNKEIGYASCVVMELMGGLLHLGYNIYADNFYCNSQLAKFLYDRKTGLVGTFRKMGTL